LLSMVMTCSDTIWIQGEEEEENEAADVPVQFSKAAPKMRSENPDFQHQMLDRWPI
jgi:hypothetical protein